MSAFISPQSPDNHPDEQPTSTATLSVVLEEVPGATIGELVRNLATAILSTVSRHTFAKRTDIRRKGS